MPETTRQSALRQALSWPVSRRSLVVMAVVGTVLNLINQGDAIFSGADTDWLKAALTYLVPFCVASYGAYTAFGETARRQNREQG
jgi:hypothetical protein